MEKKFRFYRNNEMEVLTWDELFKDARPDLVGVPVMQSFGIMVGEEQLFAEDVLELDVTGMDENALFWNSNLGQEMKEREYERAIVLMSTSKYTEMEFRVFYKAKDKFVTENEHDEIKEGEEGYDEGKGAHCVKATGNMFIRYLVNNGARIIGNSHQQPELVPPFER